MFKKLLVPLDRSALAEQALVRAAAIARAAQAEIELVLAHQAPVVDGIDVHFEADDRQAEEEYLDDMAREMASGAGVPVGFTVVDGLTIDAICRRAREVKADLVVMTSHGRTGLRRVWAGSVADGVMRRSSIPVLMLRPTDNTATSRRSTRHSFKRILVLLEDSSSALEILRPAARLARCGGGRLTLLRVIQPVPIVPLEPPGPYVPVAVTIDDAATEALLVNAVHDLTTVADTLAVEEGVDVDGQVIVGRDVARAARDYIKGHRPDLIAMTTHGRGASRLIVPSIVDQLIRTHGLPLLLLKPKRETEPAVPETTADAAGDLLYAMI